MTARQVEDAYRLMQEIPIHPNMKNIIELKGLDNKIRLLIGKDMVYHNDVISKSIKKVSLHGLLHSVIQMPTVG